MTTMDNHTTSHALAEDSTCSIVAVRTEEATPVVADDGPGLHVGIRAAVEQRRYCRQCEYDLRGLREPRCPECGRRFDPEQPHTFLTRPRRRWWRRILFGVGAPFAFVALLIGVVAAWVYYGWRVERDTLLAEPNLWVYRTRPLGGDDLRAHLGPFGNYLDRANAIAGGVEMTEKDFAAIGHFRQLQRLRISGPEVTDANVAHLAGLTNLTELALYKTELTDAGLAQLQGLRHLQVLQVGSGRLTGSALARFDLTDLRELTLFGTHINDAALPPLAHCTHLETLNLFHGNFTDAGLLHLRGFHHLQVLAISGDNLTGSSLGRLDLSELRQLWLGGAHLDDTTILPLTGCARLECLELAGEGITDTGLRELKTLRSLHQLYLRATATTDAGRHDLQDALPGVYIFLEEE